MLSLKVKDDSDIKISFDVFYKDVLTGDVVIEIPNSDTAVFHLNTKNNSHNFLRLLKKIFFQVVVVELKKRGVKKILMAKEENGNVKKWLKFVSFFDMPKPELKKIYVSTLEV